MTQKILNLFKSAFMAFLLFYVIIPSCPTAHAKGMDMATDFILRDIDGQKVHLSDFKGKVILMSFWATWCGPCKIEMVHLNQLYEANKENDFVLLSISIDDARSASQVKPYIKRKGYKFPVLLDRSSTVSSIYNPTKTVPYTILIDKKFRISKIYAGFNSGDEVNMSRYIDGLFIDWDKLREEKLKEN